MAGTLEFDGVPVDITTVSGEDLVVVPGTGGNFQIGDAAGSNLFATSNDDLHITGILESDGAAYLDGGVVAGSNVIPDVDLTHNLGSSSKYWNNLYVTNVYANDLARIKSVDYSWPAAQGAANTVLKNDGAGNLSWGVGGGGGSGTVNAGLTGFFAYYPADGTTVDDQAVLSLSGGDVVVAADLNASGDFLLYDQTPVTGTTTLTVRSGAGQGTDKLMSFTDGTFDLAGVDEAHTVFGKGLRLASAYTSTEYVSLSTYGVFVASDRLIGFSSGAAAGGPIDTAFYRNAAGVVEVNTGTAGQFRDIKLRSLDMNDGFVAITEMAVAPAASAADTGRIYFDATDNKFKVSEHGGIYVDLIGSAGAPADATYITQVAAPGLSGEQALGALATGLLKNTTTTGILSIAAQGTDYYAPAGTDVALGDGGTGASLAAPAGDRLLGIENGGSAAQYIILGTGLSYDAPTDTLSATATGNGDVVGPAGATDNAITRFDSTTGKLVQNSGVLIDDTDNVSGVASLTLVDGGSLRTTQVSTDNALIQAYDVDGTAYTTFGTLTAGNDPGFDLADSVTKAGAYIYRAGGTDIPLGDGGTGASLADPNAHRLMGWDNTDNATRHMVIGTGLSYDDATDTLSAPETGDVSSSANLTDNAVVRGDGGAKGVQTSGLLIDDTDNLSGVASLTLVDGGSLRTTQVDTDNALIQAYDVDGTAYTTFGTLTAGNDPGFNLADSVTKAGAYIYRAGGTDIPLGDGGTGASLADPNAHRVMGWDNTDNAVKFLTLGSGLSYDDVTDTLSSTVVAGDNVTVNATVATDLNFLDVAATGTVTGSAWSLATVADPDNLTLGISNASDTVAGSVTTGTQTIAGAKTFTSAVTTPGVSSASGNVTLQPAGTGTTANVVIGAANGGGGSATPDLLVLDKASGSAPTGVAGALFVDSAGKININESGTWKVLCNTTDAACGAGSGAALSAIQNAAGPNSISNADHAQAWNWALTNDAKTAFAFNESAAATNGTGTQFILEAGTAAGSTAGPFKVTSNSADVGDVVINLASLGDFIIQDNGTPFASFNDDGTVLFAGDITVPTEAYDASAWNSDLTVATKDAIRDKFESLNYYVPGGTDVPLADGGTGASLADPNAHRIMGWDNTDNAVKFLILGTGLSYDDVTDTLSAQGTGDVVGPAGATDNAMVRFDSTTGKLIQDSDVVVDDSENVSGVTSLTLATGGSLRTATLNANTALLQAYDVDGTAYTTFGTLTAGNDPAFDLSDSVTKAGAYIYRAGGTDIPLADGGTGASLADPNAHRVMGWDNTDNATRLMIIGTGLSYDDASDTLSSAGITTLNTLTAGSQTFATGTTGTDFNIASATSTHTFHMPDASATARGVVTTGTQTFGGTKTFTSPVLTTPIIKGEAVVALTDGATIATDAALGNIFWVESAANRTFDIPTNPTTGQKCIWRWKNTDSSAHTMTFTTAGAGSFRFGTTVQGVSATPAGRTDYLGAIYNATDNRWDVIAYAKGYN